MAYSKASPFGGSGGSSVTDFTDLGDVPSSYSGQATKVVRVNVGETALEFFTLGAGTGDVVGPASATDNAIVRYDLTTGKLIQNSAATIDDSGVLSTTGALLTGLTASRALVTDGSKNLTSSSTTSTELGYVSGVTSAIQTQLDDKAPLASPTFTGTVSTAQLSTTSASTNTIAGDSATHGAILVRNSNASGPAISLYESSFTYRVNLKTPEALAASYTLTFPLNDGDASQVLTTNGSGVLSWSTPAGGDMTLSGVQTVTGAKTFGAAGNVGKLILAGSTSGTSILNAAAIAGSTTLTLPGTTGTIALNPMTTGGDLIYGGASGVETRLANGTNGQVLTSSGGTAAPTWTTPAASASVSSQATNFTAANNTIYLVSSASARNITLPAASSGLRFWVKDSTGSCGTNNFTIVRAGSESIDGITANRVLQTNWGSWTLVCDGTNWFIL
jgi:hypothetical protein